MANDSKKYVSLNRLQTFLENLTDKFAALSHKHTMSDITDISDIRIEVDTELSSTSNNPVANSALNAEFDAIGNAMGALELSIDGKADEVHNHDDMYYTEIEMDAKLENKADKTHSHTVANITDLTATATELNYMDGVTSNVQVQLDEKANTTHIHPYGVCSSSATYTTKTVSVENFSLVEGARVVVKFINANNASSPKLNVNETGAIPIMRYGDTTIGSNAATNGWEAGAVIAFTYDGTNWVRDYWYNTTYTNAELGQGYGTCYTSTSTVEKEVSMSNYADKTGGIVSIKFTYSVDAGATLNINGQGAMDIDYNGSAIGDDVIKGGDIATFICSGASYQLISVDRWHEDIAELQASESKVKQMETAANGNFPILLAPSDINGTEYRYTYYADGIYANPYISKIYANISGNAGSASKLADDSAEKIQLNYGGIPIVTTSGDGAAYTASVDGMDILTVGMTFMMIPHTVSTSTAPTLNVNNLGAKAIRRMVSNSTTSTSVGYNASWLAANKPIRVTYNGTFWIADLTKPAAADVSGTMAVSNGGTGYNTIEDTVYTTARYRASSLVNADTNPSTNGVINWTYK